MRLVAWVAVVLVLPASGCLGSNDEASIVPQEGDDAPPMDAGTNETEPAWPPVNVTVSERNLRLAMAAAGQDVTGWGNNWGVRPAENTTGYVFQLEWTPSPTDAAAFSLVLAYNPRSSATSNQYLVVARSSGESPLRLAVGGERLHANESHTLSVYPGSNPAGLIVEKPVRLTVFEFRDRPFDPTVS